jgi:hypothetical protein
MCVLMQRKKMFPKDNQKNSKNQLSETNRKNQEHLVENIMKKKIKVLNFK